MLKHVTSKSYAALLFDMDGTLLSSVAAAERVWGRWAERHGLDAEAFLPTIHGVRAEDTIRRQNLADIDIEAEVEWVTKAEIEDVEGIMPIGGISAFLKSLPPDRWAIVTSASLALASKRLKAAGVTPPPVFITAEDVTKGKPHPDPFLAAADRLGVSASECLVFEDAPAGIQAAEAAGADVMVIKATHQHPMETPHASVHDYSLIQIDLDEQGRIRITETKI
ncbi:HAD family hydrolase [Rhizobium sp. KVB221]|uniref:HAD family hydrolase n=1 Tax=Rhizobium setariae TaxID=2801340 RepID=A0A936YQH2_9HYPH|nr:HAD family hydrolase [Rhizobium setariae]MBL0372349.1 HAD family hydrolase [Rhizobium setariae]